MSTDVKLMEGQVFSNHTHKWKEKWKVNKILEIDDSYVLAVTCEIINGEWVEMDHEMYSFVWDSASFKINFPNEVLEGIT